MTRTIEQVRNEGRRGPAIFSPAARLVAQSAFWLSISHLFGRGSLMAASIILARSLEVSEFATYGYFQLTVSMLAAYGAMGLGIAANKLFVDLDADTTADFRTISALITLCVLFAILAFLITISIPINTTGEDLNVPRWALGIAVFVLVLNVVPSNALLGLEKYPQAAIISAGAGLLILSIAFFAAIYKDVQLAMLAIILGGLAQLVGGALVVLSSLGWRKIASGYPFEREHLVRVLSFAGPLFLVSIVSGSAAWLVGRLILFGAGGEHAFALFTIGLQWFSLAMFLPGVMSRVFFPKLVRSTQSSALSPSTHLHVRDSIKIVTVFAVGLILFGFLFGDVVLEIYGPDYAHSRWLIGLYMLPALLAANSMMIGNAIIVSNGQWEWLVITIMWATILIGLAFFLKNFGAWAGAVAYTLSYLVMLGVATRFAAKKSFI